MDYRAKYAELTGDTTTPYAVSETDREGFMYSDATMQRAVEALLGGATFGQQDYTRRAMEKFGPRAGVGFGNLYQQTPEAGVEYFNDQILDRYSREGLGGAAMGVLGALAQPRPQRVGMVQGLIDYLRERKIRREDAAFERGLLD